MKRLRLFEIKNIINHLKGEKLSLRRRFVLYIITVITIFLALFLVLLNLFGVLNPADKNISDTLDARLLSYSKKLEHDIDHAAAYAISFAEQLNEDVENFLIEENCDFAMLRDNPFLINKLQEKLYHTVYLNMQLSPSSGAFCILDTTVNSQSPTPLYSGIYLKYVNLYSESTVNNKFTLYRGSVSMGKNNDLTFHSGWQNECKTDFFEGCDTLFTENKRYILSSVTPIPETWESARFLYVPLRDFEGNIIGVCGFEINNLYFRLAQKPSEEDLGHIVYALLNKEGNTFSGQFTSDGYHISDYSNASLKISEKKGLTVFDFNGNICVGKTDRISLENNTFTIAVMITKAQYDKYVLDGQRSFILIFLVIALFAVVFCIILSKKYVSPILKKIDSIKAADNDDSETKIKEIDDLFAFLQEKDNQYEAQKESLEYAKKIAEEEAYKAKNAYETAQKEYELVKNEIELLSAKHKNDIVLEEYEYFLCNLSSLTASEYRIYELYLQGKNVKQIAEILSIKENTLKFHNKNIYSKLGISSRKQLLKFAALKQQQDKKDKT